MTKEKKSKKSKKKKKETVKKKTTKEIKLPSLEEMADAGVHFGHRTSRWNPKMEPYIFGVRNNVHIIDLEKTYEKLKEAVEFLKKMKKQKKTVLFVGTRVNAKEITKEMATKCNMPYVNERWLGGTITNFDEISKRLEYFRDLEKKMKSGELDKYTKKERHEFNVELLRLEEKFGGIKNMTKLPDALIVLNVKHDALAVKEAKRKGIPVVGLCDTNADPTSVDYPIPCNDDASSSLKLIVGVLVEALK